jgi:predicted small lipoprotein YifL
MRIVLLALAAALLLAAASCEIKVPLGVDPQSDGAQVDAADAGT